MNETSATVVAIAMQKGGVGKTTTTVHLARGAFLAGLRTLVVDLDPQSNATSGLAAERPADDEVSMADVLDPGKTGNLPIRSVIMPSLWERVDLAPAITIPLTNAEIALSAKRIGGGRRLSKALDPIRDDYDLILIDCPPALGLLTINALVAAHSILVVMEAAQWSLDGLAMLRTTVGEIREEYNPGLEWAGIVVNKWRDTIENRESFVELQENFTDAEPFAFKVPLWAGIADSVAAQRGIDEWPGSRFTILGEQYKQWALQLTGK